MQTQHECTANTASLAASLFKLSSSIICIDVPKQLKAKTWTGGACVLDRTKELKSNGVAKNTDSPKLMYTF